MKRIFFSVSEKYDAAGDLKESEDGTIEPETPTDNEEVKIPSQDRNRKIPDFPDNDIRDKQTLSNTQREDWLLPNEPMHGVCPRQTGRESPPVIDNRPPMDATGGAAVRQPGRTLLLSPRRQILMEKEVTTPPRGSRPAPEPQGSPRGVRAVPFPDDFPEDSLRDGHLRHKDIGSPVDMLVDTVSRIQKDMAILHEENRLLRTPAASQAVQAPRRAAIRTTKVPRFDGTTSWEQYHQVFEVIVRSNGWDNDTAALQLFSHLEGDALNVAHLVPLARWLSRSGLVDALTAHYGSPGRLADYRRQFERTTRTVGEDPAIFATALETLARKAFGDMGQTARLRLIRDRFIAGHSNCELHRHLDSVSPETPIRDIVDRCRIWESHADPAVCRIGKPNPDLAYPTYAVGDADSDNETTRVAVVRAESSGGIAKAGNFDCGASGSENGGVRLRKNHTEAGEGDTDSTTHSHRPSSTDDNGTDVTLFPWWKAPTTASASATTTDPTRLDRRSVFLLRAVRPYGDALPRLE